jgi:replicative DNA helicase
MILHGIQRFEEFVVLFARLGQGKSWVLVAIIAHIWKLGFNVGYISPEMSDDNIGYRFDTITFGYSNSSLMWGTKDIDIEKYEEDIKKLKENKNKFIVSVPADFDNRITVSKLRNYIKQNKLAALAIDGVTYLTDERYRRGDSETLSLTHISQDLMALSVEMKIPILVVSQANREGAKDDVPDITNISHSDGIAQSASKVIALRQDDGNLEMLVEKNRYGSVGKKLKYIWNINVGEFISVSSDEDVSPEELAERRERKKSSGKDVF